MESSLIGTTVNFSKGDTDVTKVVADRVGRHQGTIVATWRDGSGINVAVQCLDGHFRTVGLLNCMAGATPAPKKEDK